MDRTIEHWYQKAAEIMVREGVNLFAATQKLDLGIRPSECEEIAASKEFLSVLRAERNRFYKELAGDPARSRTTAVGQLLFVIEKLLEHEQYEKAAEAIFKLSRIEGWTTEQAAQNLFFDLTGKDLTELRKKFAPTQPSVSKPN